MALEYFPFYHSYGKKCEKLTDQELGRLVRALLDFSITGEAQELAGRESIAFDFIADDIQRSKDAYEQKCRTNKASADKRYQTDANGCERMRTDANAYERIRDGTEDCERTQYKSKYKDKSKDKTKSELPPPPTPSSDLEQVMNYYMDNIQAVPSPFAVQDLKHFTEVLGADVVIHACAVAQDEGKRSWNYIRAILQRYEKEGLDSMEKVEMDEQQRRDVQEARKPNKITTAAEYAARKEKPIGKDEMEELKKFAASFG